MGKGCQINLRDRKVYADNGNESILFNDAKQIMSIENAVDVWSLAQTQLFKDEVLDIVEAEFKSNLYRQINAIPASNSEINLVIKGKETVIYPDSLDYKTVKTKNYTTYIASSQGQTIGKIRVKPYQDGILLDQMLLNDLQAYDNGKLRSIKGMGIETEMMKEVLIDNIAQSKNIYFDTNSTDGSRGVLNKFPLQRSSNGREYIQSTSLDINGEPSLTTVLNYLHSKNNETPLTTAEQNELKIALANTPFVNSEQASRALKRAFLPSPSRQSLLLSGLYSDSEITDILEDNNLQQRIIDLAYKIDNSESIDNDIQLNNDYITTSQTGKDILGKSRIDNPFINQQQVIQQLGGIKTQEEFENEVPDYILQADSNLFEEFSQYSNLPTKQIVNGELIDKPDNDTLILFEQTLQQPKNNRLETLLEEIEGYSADVWYNSPKEIKTLLEGIKKESVGIGLDLMNFPETFDSRSQEEILILTRSLDALLSNSTEDNLQVFTDTYNEFYNLPINQRRTVTLVEEKFRNRNLLYLKTKDSYINIFERFGLLPTTTENVWIKTDALEKDLEQTYSLLFQNSEKFPANIFNSNRQDLREQDIREYVRGEISHIAISDMAEKFVLYSTYFETPLIPNPIEVSANIEAQIADIYSSIDNLNYLMEDYIADARVKQIKNPELWKNIKFDEDGIGILYNDPISMFEMTSLFEQEPDLYNYLLLSKTSPIEIEGIEIFPDVQTQRDMYVNFPSLLNEYRGDFNRILPQMISTESAENFIKIDDSVYELIQDGVYGTLPVNEGNLRVFGTPSPEVLVPIPAKIFSAQKEIRNLAKTENIKEILDSCA